MGENIRKPSLFASFSPPENRLIHNCRVGESIRKLSPCPLSPVTLSLVVRRGRLARLFAAWWQRQGAIPGATRPFSRPAGGRLAWLVRLRLPRLQFRHQLLEILAG